MECRNEEEIELDDVDEVEENVNEDKNVPQDKSNISSTAPVENGEKEKQEGKQVDDPESSTSSSTTTSKAEALKLRLRTLKQKMNQARQLNQQAVQEEGERLSRQDVERKRQHTLDKKAAAEAWEARNAKALEIAKEHDIDGKFVTQQASTSLLKAHIRAEKAEKAQYSSKDYYNPEGQSLNYERNLKSLPRHDATAANSATATTTTTTATFNPLEQPVDPEQERQGARRLAEELHRRIEKQKNAQLNSKRKSDDEVTHINKRNKLFNEKIKRNYDKHTAEIRQNLERGTAL
jgi:pre-mRNA-splicing factor SYF2